MSDQLLTAMLVETNKAKYLKKRMMQCKCMAKEKQKVGGYIQGHLQIRTYKNWN